MAKAIIAGLALALCATRLRCEQDRPSIAAENGNLVLQPAYGKSIYVRGNGPGPALIVAGVDVWAALANTSSAPPATGDSPSSSLYEELSARVDRVERDVRTSTRRPVNSTYYWRRFNRLDTKILRMEARIDQFERDECQSRPCRNGGTCLRLAVGYHCLCPAHWEGKDCDLDVNECRAFAGTDLGCQNGATCINRPGSYECLCRTGWYGQHCTTRAKDCSGGDFEMCGHGTCVPVATGEGIKCICEQGWTTNGTSPACLTDVDECAAGGGAHCSANPRVQCFNLPGSFRCGACPTGYEGDGYSCSDVDECTALPNGGCSTSPMVPCYNTVGSRICGACPPGYRGDGFTCAWRGSCDFNHGGCHPSARCTELGGAVTCVCPAGAVGDGVGLRGCYVPTGNASQHCEGEPCGPHGRCHLMPRGYMCLCDRGYEGVRCENAADACAAEPCRNGGSCRADEASPRGFRCECPALYTGELCQTRERTCGGVLDAREGSIVYPLTNSTSYKHNSRCAWVISTAPELVINVTFSKFDVEHSHDCAYDYLQIHDCRSSASQLIGRFCGTDLPNGGNIVSSHNNLYFWFRSDQSVARDGFALHWTSVAPVCGGEVDAHTHGIIRSPGSPGKYPPDRDCYWHLTTDLSKRIQLHFFQFDIETHANCSFDYLEIFDGQLKTDPLLSKLCNSSQPAPIQSAGSDLLIHFHSDGFGSGGGFQISYATVEGVPGCGGYFTSENGELVSPSYNGKYFNNLLCDYRIRTSPDTKIRLIFKSFNLERSFRCMYDYVKIYDGPSSNSKLVGKFCGKTAPQTYISTTNTLYIQFKTDHSTAGEGFKIAYETVCQSVFSGDTGVLTSPGYPRNYPGHKVCEYIIHTSPGKAIQLTFADFDLEDNRYYNCMFDNVEIRDGSDSNSTLLGRYCGGSQHMPPVQTSTLNYMYVRFNSDYSISGTGFYANYTIIDTECGGIHKEPTGLINHPNESRHYTNNQRCTWILDAPPGHHIKVTWNRFDIEDGMTSSLSCSSDFLELSEVDENNENNTLGKYCGSTAPPEITTSTNRLIIKFVSDSSISGVGFSLSYTFLDSNTHCGGSYTKPHGYLHSPGWPNFYEPNRDCTWVISVPVGQQIMLNVSSFDLEAPIRNKCDYGDYLEIHNGLNENSPMVGQYCGDTIPRRITSLGNSLFLRFHSDLYLGKKGFSIEWDGSLNGCGGTLTGSRGSVSSPNYPQPYNRNAECFYKIIVNSGSRIRISFTDLDLEMSRDCNADYVQVFDGRDASATSLGMFCAMNAKAFNIETSTNYAFIKFRSDYLLGGKGFYFNYHTICTANITGTYGVIESPDFPNNYPTNLNCLWTITAPKGSKINVTFTNFNVFKSYQRPWRPRGSTFFDRRYNPSFPSSLRVGICDTDYLQIKDGNQGTFNNKMCGTVKPATIHSRTNILHIKFVTESMYPRGGFRLEWVADSCGGMLQQTYGFFFSFPAGSVSTTDPLECEWKIVTPPGMAVQLSIYDAFMKDTNNCTLDVIEVYDGLDTNSPLITKICHRMPATVTSSTNLMLVKFIKQSDLRDVSFNALYYVIGSKCGGRIATRSGIITSLHYPKNYENNLDCVWTLEVPQYHLLEFNIIDFDLYSSPNDKENDLTNPTCGDYLRIYPDYYIGVSNYTYQICPNSHNFHILSKNNYLTVQFVTDGYGTAKGFKANFTVVCGGTISVESDGILTNDEIPTTHLNDSCIWTIVAAQMDQKISLTLTHMSLPRDNSIETIKHCTSSYLRILDGNDASAPLIGEYCGRKVPSMIVSRGNSITVQLGSYSGPIIGKFSAHYSALVTACGGTLTSEEGTLASPNYPESYPAMSSCEWILNTSPGNKVYITFESLSIEYSENCNEDYLEIRENDGIGRLVGVYCGEDVPLNTTVASKLFVKFHSDGEGAGRGFVAHYGFIHGNDITDRDNGEISSPLYPHPYEGLADYWWRITTNRATQIALTIDQLEIPVRGLVCYNYLAIYDGYDNTAPVLRQLCGLINSAAQTIESSSNVVYVNLKLDETNLGSKFHIQWNKLSKDSNELSVDEGVNCGSNRTVFLSSGNTTLVESPNYPQSYDNDLKCEWVFETKPGNHLTLKFITFDLEETSSCFADYVSVYKSSTGTNDWETVREKICLSDIINTDLKADTFIKIKFNSDSSVRKIGFSANVRSDCGGRLTGLSGIIKPFWNNWKLAEYSYLHCEWSVRARSGRTLNVRIGHFNITNTNDNCMNFLTLRNGESKESPMLGNGKYCGYAHENIYTFLSTSTNALYIVYTLYGPTYQDFSLIYGEKKVECGSTLKLDSEQSWEVINSPNYPSIPIPYSECEWVFTGPPGEILKIDFVDRFDLINEVDCASEFIEIRDGASVRAPLKGRYCSVMPTTIKATSNYIYIKYVTQVLEPRNGFRANISLDICGSTIRTDEGEITSPGYPHLQRLPYGTVCEWKIIGRNDVTFHIKPEDINLPESEIRNATKITVEEVSPVSKNAVNIKTYSHQNNGVNLSPFVGLSNTILIKLYIAKPVEYAQMSMYRGFRFTFNSSTTPCGGTITESEGFLTTPGYPQEMNFAYCQWMITVPNPSRRVRLEILDANFIENKHKAEISNDLDYRTTFQIFPSTDWSSSNKVFESSSNKLGIYFWSMESDNAVRRFKAHFSSDEPALCGGTISNNINEISSPNINRTYSCEWHVEFNNTNERNFENYNTMYVKINFNTSSTDDRSYCSYNIPALIISATLGDGRIVTESICTKTEKTLRIPVANFDIRAVKGNEGLPVYFHVDWNQQPCGGVVQVTGTAVDVLKLPNNTGGSLDCAWILTSSYDSRIELRLEGTFQSSCSDEFLHISRGDYYPSTVLGEYCKDRMSTDLAMKFSNIYVEYHAHEYKNNTNLKLLASTTSDNSVCGGFLNNYDYIFTSPDFPKRYKENQECIWEISAELGNRVMLEFIDRFVIEDKPNCTKDAVLVYDWMNNEYKPIAKLCGRTLPAKYNSTFNKMKVILRTDADTNLDGFKAQWTPICGGEYNATEDENILYSPGYPSGYVSMLNCEYKIRSFGNKIAIKFLDFALEGPSPKCNYDNLTIIGDMPYYHWSQTYTYCGTDIPKAQRFSDFVTLKFLTQLYSSRKGFKIAYSLSTCGGNVTQPRVLTSHTEGDTYDLNLNCTWIIRAPTNKHVVIKFSFIDLEDNYQCYNDYISVFEGWTIDPNKRRALLCGHINTTTVLRSTENNMVVQFVTDSSLNFKGFVAGVSFSYNCGGHINLTTTSQTVDSPFFDNQIVYAEFLDCYWTVEAPSGKIIQVEFTKFHIAPCRNINQTALRLSKCDCDVVEIRDGINPNSFLIGTYCGHNMPQTLTSSTNLLSLRLSTDGEISSSGFSVRLSTRDSTCGQNTFTLSRNIQKIKSPGYDMGTIPRSLHCSYNFLTPHNQYTNTHFRINNMDLQAGTTQNLCDKDMLIITSIKQSDNVTLGTDLIMNRNYNPFFDANRNFYEILENSPKQIVLCGIKKSVDLYLTGNIKLNLITTAESDKVHKGIELEVSYVHGCSRNYTEPQGRIQTDASSDSGDEKCNILIQVPENYTISVYFIYIQSWDDDGHFLQIFDGDNESAPQLASLASLNSDYGAYSTGRHMLIRSTHALGMSVVYDLNYLSTDKGQGCGGRLQNIIGIIASPLYPDVYRKVGSCEWELETPADTRLKLHFKIFDLGAACAQNYVQLYGRDGNLFATYCEEPPADYTSVDNYVKIVFTTTMNNSGSGWVAQFVSLAL